MYFEFPNPAMYLGLQNNLNSVLCNLMLSYQSNDKTSWLSETPGT